MKLSVRLIVIGLVAITILSIGSLRDVSAQSAVNEEQIQRIQDNCSAIKSTLNQLHASDALLRVNRGQLYDAVATKLMNNFNSRLGNNSLDNKGLIVVTSSYQTALTAFRNDYQSYEKQLSNVLRIDCSKQPTDFHAALEDARTKRTKVHGDVLRLNQYIDDYRSAVSDFYINYQRVSGNS